MALLLLLASPAMAEDLRPAVRAVTPAVVAVGTVAPARRPPGLPLGTGFAVDGARVVTNAHVLPPVLDPALNERLVVFIGHGTQPEARPARALCVDSGHDLAVLAVAGPPLTPVELGDDAAASEGMGIAFTGFPLASAIGMYPATHRGIISAITPVAVPVIQSGQLTAEVVRRAGENPAVFQLDAIAYPGNSGSPLYEQDSGRVIGVVDSTWVKTVKEATLVAIAAPSGISYAIPIRHVRALLAEERCRASSER